MTNEFSGERSESPPPPPEYINVDMGEWRSAQPPDKLVTDNVYACTGVAMFDNETSTGYLGHFPTDTPTRIECMADDVLNAGANAGDLTAWVGGTSPLDWEGNTFQEFIDDFRAQTLDALQSRGIEVAETCWLESDQALDLELDCATGVVTPTIYDNPIPEEF